MEKIINPSFVQGLTKKQFKKLVIKNVKLTMKSISKDGSAFEGNQKLKIRKFLVDIRWPYYKKILMTALAIWKPRYP